MIFKLYRILIFLATPFILLLLKFRKYKGKEDSRRFPERLGRNLPPRPAGQLVWMHGASVGECLSMLPLIKKMLEKNPDMHIMVTSGTVTSAGLMQKRLPDRAFHVFSPVDLNGATRRFVRHFQPDAVLWFESEFWPNILHEIHSTHTPLILLNGRVSDKSFAKWQRHSYLIKSLLGLFTLAFGQTEEDRRRLDVLGAPHTVCVGNIKYAAPPAPFDEKELKHLLESIGNRPCWLGGSTHPDEESKMADIHIQTAKAFPGLLTISAPRHPERGDEIQSVFEKKGLTVARRTKGEVITDKTDVYLADTLGEMGLIYRLAPIVFVGGSLVEFGGQNMLEPMRLGKVVLIGPHAFNFREIVATAKNKGAVIEVPDVAGMMGNLVYYFKHPEERVIIGARAEELACSEMAVLDRVYSILEKEIDLK